MLSASTKDIEFTYTFHLYLTIFQQILPSLCTMHSAPRVELHSAPRVELHSAPRVELHSAPRVELHSCTSWNMHAPELSSHSNCV